MGVQRIYKYTKNIQMYRLQRLYKHTYTNILRREKQTIRKTASLKNDISKTGQSHAKNQTVLLSHTVYKNNCKMGNIFKCKI